MAFFVALASFATAQEKKRGDKPTKEQRIEFRVNKMQKKLKLSEAVAAEFAPLYKEYLQAMAECRPQLERGKNLTDEQVVKNIEARLTAEQKVLDVKREYLGKFSKILNAKQLRQLFGKNDAPGKSGDRRHAPCKYDGGKRTPDCKDGRHGGCEKHDCDNGDCKKDDCKKKDNCKKDCKK